MTPNLSLDPMDRHAFLAAVAPVVCVEILLDVPYQLFAPMPTLSRLGDVPLLFWVFSAVSFIVLPFWAGARVARANGKRRWSALGGVSVFLASVVASAFTEFFEPSPFDSWVFVLVAMLITVPLYALMGFLGGTFQRIRVAQ